MSSPGSASITPSGSRRSSTASPAGGSAAPGPVAPDSARAIQMLHDKVLVKPANAGERTTRAGILIPATAEVAKRLVWGEVVGVGQHVRSVKGNDRVLYSPDDQYEVEVSGDTYLVLRERDLQAVFDDHAGGGTGLYL